MDAIGKRRRKYTAAERERALGLYMEVGPAEAGRETGIPSATIRKWAQRAGASVKDERERSVMAAVEGARLSWAQRRAEIAQRAGEAAALFLERAIEANPRAGLETILGAFAAGVLLSLIDRDQTT